MQALDLVIRDDPEWRLRVDDCGRDDPLAVGLTGTLPEFTFSASAYVA